MTPRTAHAHDIVTETLDGVFGTDWEYWNALSTIINAPKKDWAECDAKVRAAAIQAVRERDLNGRSNV